MKQKIVLVVSIALGLLAAVLTRTYLAAKDAEFARERAAFAEKHGVMDVLCYGRDTPAGTVMRKADLCIKTVPKSGLNGQALTEANVNDIVGRKILLSHKYGDVIFWADVEGGNPVAGGLAADVKRQMRAVSINASGAAAVSGMVRPNDHVDVLGTFTFPSADGKKSDAEMVTCTILQNVLVLATGRQTAKTAAQLSYGSSAAEGYATVTLEVTPREAEMLVFAEQIRGRLSLTLRNRSDTSYEKELPKVDFAKIRSEIEELNAKRQIRMSGK